MNSFEKTSQFISGLSVADFLDDYFTARGWAITPTTPHEERKLCLGDRHFKRDRQHLLIEYKSGLQTAKTGNVFLETISVDSKNVPGWVYTCAADYLFYGALLNKKILIFVPDKLRATIETLKTQFRTVKTGKHQNKGYDTHGVIVPLAYAEQNLAEKTIQLLDID